MKNFLLALRLTSMINEIPTLEIRIGFPLPASSSCVVIRESYKRCLSFSKEWHRVLDKIWRRLLVKRCRRRHVTYQLLKNVNWVTLFSISLVQLCWTPL